MARLARRSAGFPAATAAVAALAAALAGCATAPSGGPPRAAPGGNSQVQAYVQPLPPSGPTNLWTPREVVNGFLHASASYAFDAAAARQYLAPGLRRKWNPARGSVTVIGKPVVTPLPYNPRQNLGGGQASSPQIVELTGQHLATLSQSLQYQYALGENVNDRFVLAKTNGVWLIQQLPPQQTLMLTESDFQEVYQPRNLFFFAPASASQVPGVLVPDPVYAPLQSSNSALNTDLATRLVNGLLQGQSGWLSGATSSAFPRGTRLLKKVTITGKTAQVDLGGAAAHAQQSRIQRMADQLLATLSDGEYSRAPLASSLQLYINNKPRSVYRAGNLVPTVPSGEPVQLVTGASSVSQLPAQPARGAKPQVRAGPGQIGSAIVTAVAASPGPDHPLQLAVAVRHGAGCAVYEQQGAAYKPFALSSSGGPCTSLSFDASGTLWAAAGGGVWVLYPGRPPVAVDLSAMTAAIKPGDQILALRMAPDAVRAALLVRTPTGNRLILAAVDRQSGVAWLGQPVTVGTADLTEPLAISWYDAYHLAVLFTDGIYEVPLTGGAGQQPEPQLISTAPPGALTLTTDGTELVVGTSQGQVYAKAVSSSSPAWPFATNGADPVYPG